MMQIWGGEKVEANEAMDFLRWRWNVWKVGPPPRAIAARLV